MDTILTCWKFMINSEVNKHYQRGRWNWAKEYQLFRWKYKQKKYYKIYIYPIVVINSIFFKSNKNFRPPSLSYKCVYGEAIYAGWTPVCLPPISPPGGYCRRVEMQWVAVYSTWPPLRVRTQLLKSLIWSLGVPN